MTGNRTFMARKETVQRNWFLIDATDVPAGRLASRVALILTGKNKPIYTPHVDTGDFVVIINADKVGLTGNKLETSKVHSYSGYPGGFKEMTYGEAMKRSSVRLLERIIKGMRPKHNHLNFGRKLKVYAGADHPHAAQKPVTITL